MFFNMFRGQWKCQWNHPVLYQIGCEALFRAIKRLVEVVAGLKWNLEKRSHWPAWAETSILLRQTSINCHSQSEESGANSGLKSRDQVRNSDPWWSSPVRKQRSGWVTHLWSTGDGALLFTIVYEELGCCCCYGCDSLVHCWWVKKWFSNVQAVNMSVIWSFLAYESPLIPDGQSHQKQCTPAWLCINLIFWLAKNGEVRSL